MHNDTLQRNYLYQRIVFLILKVVTIFVVGVLFFVLFYIFSKGIGTVLRGSFWIEIPKDGLSGGGILPAIVGTTLLTLLSILLSSAVGIPAGIFMAEYAPKKSILKVLVDIMTNNLAGIPSIVFGLFGMSLFVIQLNFGDSILAGSLTLAIMVLPVIIRTTEQAVKAVPDELRLASIGMGATKFQTIWRIILPVSFPRIITGIILSIGRVAGETAPILFTVAALYLPQLPRSIFDQVMALPYHLYVLCVSSPDPQKSLPQAFGTALVLLLMVLVLNLIATYIRNQYKRKYKLK
ncbi:MAG: phosphate ABC transporter permease PstA [Bacteroidia bacterium]|nr:phosphate ABC transporter permease PstA [Bacteroidia bacterium]MDW8157397.1 phosphate ABC transporter permease PstA [Bacteroidia bacterium]